MDKKARAAINRANAQKSTGPKTEAGKSTSKYNALKHGLNCHRALDINGFGDREALANIRATFENEYHPQTLAETLAVEALIETEWQISRVRRLLDLAFTQGAGLQDTAKMFDSYSRHQSRLHRMNKDHTARLEHLLALRDPNDPGLLTPNRESTPEHQPNDAPTQQKPNDLPEIGFVPYNPEPDTYRTHAEHEQYLLDQAMDAAQTREEADFILNHWLEHGILPNPAPKAV